MTQAQVAISRAAEYDYATVAVAIRRALNLIGGVEQMVKPGARVFLKINQLPPPSPAERGVVTHPVFVRAAAGILKAAGAEVTVGDDIGSDQPDGFTVSGVRQACGEAGVNLVNLRETGFTAKQIEGRVLRQVYLARTALEADLIVNLPKLKTHALTAFTGAVKNLYGCLPGGLRVRLHGDHINPDEFALMLTDVYAALKPQINIMDGVMAMQGEGPANGTLYPLGLVLASTDGVALDAAACRIIGLAPFKVSTTRYAHERGLGVGDIAQIEILGEALETLIRDDFKLPPSAAIGGLLKLISRLPWRQGNARALSLVVKPRVIPAACTGCGACVQICPTEAATLNGDNISTIDYTRCIRCLCCYEACRDSAIETVEPAFTRIIGKVRKIFKKRERRA